MRRSQIAVVRTRHNLAGLGDNFGSSANFSESCNRIQNFNKASLECNPAVHKGNVESSVELVESHREISKLDKAEGSVELVESHREISKHDKAFLENYSATHTDGSHIEISKFYKSSTENNSDSHTDNTGSSADIYGSRREISKLEKASSENNSDTHTDNFENSVDLIGSNKEIPKLECADLQNDPSDKDNVGSSGDMRGTPLNTFKPENNFASLKESSGDIGSLKHNTQAQEINVTSLAGNNSRDYSQLFSAIRRNRNSWAEVLEWFENFRSLFLQKGPDINSDSKGLRFLGGREMAQTLQRNLLYTEENLRQVLQKINELREACYPECFKFKLLSPAICNSFKYHILLLNERQRSLSLNILETVIDRCNSQAVYDEIASYLSREITDTGSCPKFDLMSCFHVLSYCLNKGATPSMEDITTIQLLIQECGTNETLLATLQMVLKLVKAQRKPANLKDTLCSLNPLLNHYILSKEIIETATELVVNCFSSIEECWKSNVLISVLLYISAKEKHSSIQDKNNYFQQIKLLIEKEYACVYFNYPKYEENEIRKRAQKSELNHSNVNWFQRGILHLAVICFHDENVLNSIPEDIVEEELNKKDLHGSTPLHIAYLHHNEAAIRFLKLNGAKEDELDLFHNSPQSLSCHARVLEEGMGKGQYLETEYHRNCSTVMTVSSGVFENLKPMLLMPDPERDIIAGQVVQLFKMLMPDAEEVRYGGSVREKLKVGRFDEIDLQIFLGQNSDFANPENSVLLHAHLIRGLAKVQWSGISLRPFSLRHPWKFMWEGQGSFRHMIISVDVVPIKVEDSGEDYPIKKYYMEQQGLLLSEEREHNEISFLKWSRYTMPYVNTSCEYEWDILDSLPVACRLGILIAKALLTALEKLDESHRSFNLKMPITSYVVKNSLFWILSGQLLQERDAFRIQEMPKFDEEIRSKLEDWRLKSKHPFNPNPPDWFTEEEIDEHAEGGRLWAERIIMVIREILKNSKLPHSFFGGYSIRFEHDTAVSVNADHLIQICDRLLGRLQPDVFFG